MVDDLIKLIHLQKLDYRLADLNRLVDGGPELLAAVDAEKAAAEAQVEESLEKEREMLKRRRQIEAEIADADEKIKANQGRQLQAKNNDEYRALLKEAEYLRKNNSAREDEALALIDASEKIAVENERLKGWLEEERGRLAEQRAQIEANLAQSRAAQMELDGDRQALVAGIQAKNMALYKRVYAGRNGRAVSRVVEGVCTECHIHLPPQSYNDLQKNEMLLTCPNCLRIMFWQGHPDFADM